MNDKHFTHDEVSLMSIYNAAGTREGLIAALTEMRGYFRMCRSSAAACTERLLREPMRGSMICCVRSRRTI